jgi:hypothetical protein
VRPSEVLSENSSENERKRARAQSAKKKPRAGHYPSEPFTNERGTFLPGTGWVK